MIVSKEDSLPQGLTLKVPSNDLLDLAFRAASITRGLVCWLHECANFLYSLFRTLTRILGVDQELILVEYLV